MLSNDVPIRVPRGKKEIPEPVQYGHFDRAYTGHQARYILDIGPGTLAGHVRSKRIEKLGRMYGDNFYRAEDVLKLLE